MRGKIRRKSKKFVQEFQDFIMGGNIITVAIGVVTGGALGRISSSLVSNILSPLIGWLFGGADFEDIYITLPPIFADKGVAVIRIGIFLQTILDFLIIAFAVFLVVKTMNVIYRKAKLVEVEKENKLSREEELLEEILEELRKERVG